MVRSQGEVEREDAVQVVPSAHRDAPATPADAAAAVQVARLRRALGDLLAAVDAAGAAGAIGTTEVYGLRMDGDAMIREIASGRPSPGALAAGLARLGAALAPHPDVAEHLVRVREGVERVCRLG